MDFTAFNNFFDKIFVVTLKRSVKRQAHIQKALQGLRYEFFWGADKNDLIIDDLKAKNIYNDAMAVKHHRYNKPMNPGQVGCALSHRNIYDEIVQHNYQRTLILEDDAEPVENSIRLFPEMIRELPAGWELLYLDYSKNEKNQSLKKYWYHIQRFAGGLKWDHNIINNLYPKQFSHHLSIAGFHDYTDAYAVSLEGAKKLLELQSPVSYVADNLLAIASASKKVNAFITRPKLFQQLSQGETSSFESLL